MACLVASKICLAKFNVFIFDSNHKQATGLFDGVQDLWSRK